MKKINIILYNNDVIRTTHTTYVIYKRAFDGTFRILLLFFIWQS
jgi:hypothetical protein